MSTPSSARHVENSALIRKDSWKLWQSAAVAHSVKWAGFFLSIARPDEHVPRLLLDEGHKKVNIRERRQENTFQYVTTDRPTASYS
jgi:hypothetical protein